MCLYGKRTEGFSRPEKSTLFKIMSTISPRGIRRMLQSAYPQGEASALARIVCCEMLGQAATDYYLGKDITLSAKSEKDLHDILHRLLRFEPVQYVQGEAVFLGRRFKVTPDVLIPRPETGELVELILDECPPAHSVLDVGTGSGCIAISLSCAWPSAGVEAWDVSEAALRVARANSAALGARVCFRQCDVLAPLFSVEPRFDLIVSNPPYITCAERKEMERNVLDWEPSGALFVPDDDPLRFYSRIAGLGMSLLRPGGRLYFEINRAYGPQTADVLRRCGYAGVSLRRDLSGNDRFVSGYLP